MGYPSDLLSSRAVVKPGMYAIIPPEGRVFNVIPGIEGCRMTILCTPKMGAGFVLSLIHISCRNDAKDCSANSPPIWLT